jgi:adenosylcobinamide-GDP ribazoletransferase
MNGFWSALAFLTRLPLPAAERDLRAAVAWLPVVGLLIGAMLAAADWALRLAQFSSLVASTATVVLLLVLSGALHADGLMDTCDAVFSHATPERRLEIMRDPHAGAFGVVGIVCGVALKIAAVDALPATIRPQTLILGPGLGRWAIVLLATTFPYGRKEGLGAPLKAAAKPGTLAIATVVPAAACVLVGPVGVACGIAASVLALALGRWLMHLLPGLTGDCYGAVCEVVETIVWLGAAPLARVWAG